MTLKIIIIGRMAFRRLIFSRTTFTVLPLRKWLSENSYLVDCHALRKMSISRMSFGRMTISTMTVDIIAINRMTNIRMALNRMTISRTTFNRMTIS
jgi:hypothetical protein